MNYRNPADADHEPAPPRVPTAAEASLAAHRLIGWSMIRCLCGIFGIIGAALTCGLVTEASRHIATSTVPTLLFLGIALYAHHKAETLADIEMRHAASKVD